MVRGDGACTVARLVAVRALSTLSGRLDWLLADWDFSTYASTPSTECYSKN